MTHNNKPDEVLLNTFNSRNKQFKVFYHLNTLTWERVQKSVHGNKTGKKVSIPVQDIISVSVRPLKCDNRNEKNGVGSSAQIRSPTGSYQIYPSGIDSPSFHLSPGSPSYGRALYYAYDDSLLDLKEFTINYAKPCKCDSKKLGFDSITFRSNDSKIIKQWIITLNACLGCKYQLY